MNRTLRSILVLGLTLGLAAVGFAQRQSPGTPHQSPGPRGPHGFGPHGPGPLVCVLDVNHDGVISADEIANSATSLKTLDTNGDGTISADELCPFRPADAPVPPPNAPRLHQNNPLILALDANGDGELSAAEITNAPASLAALDLNHDGQLTPDEWRLLPPQD